MNGVVAELCSGKLNVASYNDPEGKRMLRFFIKLNNSKVIKPRYESYSIMKFQADIF
jgi:hypothetical protein